MLKFLQRLFITLFIPSRKLRRQLRERYGFKKQCLYRLSIHSQARALIVAPHPDDEVIGCGGILAKYGPYCDVICMGSSGVPAQIDGCWKTGKERSQERIQEFRKTMKACRVQNHWIFETCGENPKKPYYQDQMLAHIPDYLRVIDFSCYTTIFLPSPDEDHPEHAFITRQLIKTLIRKGGKIKKEAMIAYYEVWTPLQRPNSFEDITEVVQKKRDSIQCYKSRKEMRYEERMLGLNTYRALGAIVAGCVDISSESTHFEAFQVLPILSYL